MSATSIALLVLVVVAVGVVILMLRRSPRASQGVDLSAIQTGPIRHSELAPELIERIKAFQSVFADLYPQTLEQWIEGFQRDVHPEQEIAIWESIARALTAFSKTRELTGEARQEAFGLLLQRSGTSDDKVLEGARLKQLTRDDAKRLLSLYSSPPEPITVRTQ